MASKLTHPVRISSARDKRVPAVAGANPAFEGVPSGTSATSDSGFVVCNQSVTVGNNGSTAVDGTIQVPNGAIIRDIVPLVTTAFNSATSNTLSIGYSSGGTQLLTSLDVKTAAGRIPLTSTHVAGTQAGNWVSGVGSNTTIYCTQTPVGSASAGSVTVSISYVVTT